MAQTVQYVVYYRLSEPKRRKLADGSIALDWGMSREAQESAVNAYIATHPGSVVATYHEIESAFRKRSSVRPELTKALAHCKQARAVLVIAKLDRLARRLHFVTGLMEAGIPFVACDMPDAQPFQLHIYAALAEQESRNTSARTKAALAAYKARGGLLGGARPECRNLPAESRQKGAQEAGRVSAQVADEYYRQFASRIGELRQAGLSLHAIAARFNSEGLKTQRGSAWNQVQVLRVIRRFSAPSSVSGESAQ